MKKSNFGMQIDPKILLGGEKPVLFAGPCAVESMELCLEVAERVSEWATQYGFHYVFKGSFDKANRTSAGSYRGLGMDKALQVLQAVKDRYKVPLLTDVHERSQVKEAAEVIDVLQIPAFLCRQTDLLVAAAETGKAVKIKRGQFMAPEDMRFAVDKVRAVGNDNVCLTERGFSLGYHNLVVDMRALPQMRQFAPVVFDVTHSIQQPGAQGGSSGGQREFAPYLARAAGAAGVDGFFVETHPNPSQALSDGPNMVPLHNMESFINMLYESWSLGNKYENFELE
ncbi:3-deoxy-8-phosphooctulonate synthase [Pleomorphovibrio marinus]|uniref:3-deoxy-8-phosphooctulonate synthase n=1 Tax=Pleomorphovibrio marinus TaxID=2164132 RepID=UPI000E0A55E3|nr:3-deoxy-8-phosphooctulonate synthase [Pleomorphovibrio marinus]